MIALSSNLNTYPDTELYSLLCEDDENCFRFIYDKYHNRIYGVAMRYLKSDIISEEVVQEVFMKLWIERKNIKSGTPLEAWLYTVAKNNTINRLKKIATEWKAINYLKVNQKNYDDSAEDKLKNSDCNRLLNEALKVLSVNQLKVYKLSREENLSYVQIAQELSISPLTVKTHMSRALAHLKLFFTGY